MMLIVGATNFDPTTTCRDPPIPVFCLFDPVRMHSVPYMRASFDRLLYFAASS